MESDSGRPTLTQRGKRSALPFLIFVAVALIMGLEIQLQPFNLSYPGAQSFSRFIQELAFDCAVAVLIAFLVKEMIERDYERRQQAAMFAAADESRRAVLKTLFRTVYDDEMVEAICQGSLSSSLIRTGFKATYCFSKHPRSRWLLHLDIIFEYTVTNAGMVTVPFDATARVGNYGAIFRQDEGLSPPRLKSATFGRHALSLSEIEPLNTKVAAADPPCNPAEFPIGKRDLKKGESQFVRLAYEREKLICDDEVMTMSYPTKNVTITVENRCGPDVEIGLREVGQQGFGPPTPLDGDGCHWKCSNEGVLLQGNGWVLYWNDLRLRPSENDPLATHVSARPPKAPQAAKPARGRARRAVKSP